MARLHATVRWRGGSFVVVHEGRKNPTRVNGVEVERERVLEPGDEIQLGERTRIRFTERASGSEGD